MTSENLFKIVAYDALFDTIQNDIFFTLLSAEEKESIFNAITDQPIRLSVFMKALEKLEMSDMEKLKSQIFELMIGFKKDKID